MADAFPYWNNLFFKIVFTLAFSELNSFPHGAAPSESYTPESVFSDVYSKCFASLSYTCIQRKTLFYLQGLNDLSEIPIVGEYFKLVKVNKPAKPSFSVENATTYSSQKLTELIDDQVDEFFDNHALLLGREKIALGEAEEEGRKKKRRGGGGGGGGGGHGDGKMKKMMMMGLMCMKMKLMMIMPAMMGMMGMMSFKGMMFGMMSFMIAKMMLLMKLLQSKGGGGVGDSWGGGGAGGWAAGKMAMIKNVMSGGGGGGQTDNYGGPGGGYNAAGEWQSRNIATQGESINNLPNRRKRASTLGPVRLNEIKSYSDYYSNDKETTKPDYEIGNIIAPELEDITSPINVENTPYYGEYSLQPQSRSVLEYDDIFKAQTSKHAANLQTKENCTTLKQLINHLKNKQALQRSPRQNEKHILDDDYIKTIHFDFILNSTDGDLKKAPSTPQGSKEIEEIEIVTAQPLRLKRSFEFLWPDEPTENKKKPKKKKNKKSKFQKMMTVMEEDPWI